MADHEEPDYAALMGEVARLLLGEPRQGKGTSLRWGGKGSMSVDLEKGTFYDFEASAGGGVLDLIAREQRCDRRGAIEWLQGKGLINGIANGGAHRPRREQERHETEDPRPREVTVQAAGPSTAAPTFYDYRDNFGTTTYRIERVPLPNGEHSFRQHGPDGRGGFHSAKGCMQGVTPLPYRLPDLLTFPDATVWITEGEKDADRLYALGLIAVTNSGGASNWRPELNHWLQGRTCIALEDNDEAGRKRCAKLVTDLGPIVASIVTLRLPNLPEKGDVSDWLDQGGSIEQLEALAKAASVPASDDPALVLIDPARWTGIDIPARMWAIDQLIPHGQATLLTGAGSAGKSLVGQLMCTCIAAGLPFLGINIGVGQASSLYITCEDDAEELHRRQAAICEGLGISLDALSGRLHLLSLQGEVGNELSTFDPSGRMMIAPRYRQIEAACLGGGIRFCTLDNSAHFFSGNENDRHQVASFMGLTNRLAQAIDGSVLLLGHPNKAGASYSGSTAWENQVRSRLFMESPKAEEGEVVNPDLRVLRSEKANYARKGAEVTFIWHKGSFALPDVVPPDIAKEHADNALANHDNDAFLSCLAKTIAEQRATSASRAAASYAPRVFHRMTMGKGISVERFEAAMERLLHLGVIASGVKVFQRENRQWVTGVGCTNPCTNHAPTDARECTNHE